MARLDKYHIKHELGTIYLTNDDRKFISLDEAIKHQKKLTNEIKSGKGD